VRGNKRLWWLGAAAVAGTEIPEVADTDKI
jgi:hypothetical protein